MTIFLLIKGDEAEAKQAAAKRGIDIFFAGPTKHGGETIARTSNLQGDRVVKWFAEDQGSMPPFDDGTLLHFSVL